MTKHDDKKRSPEATWRALQEQDAADDAARILALSEAEVDAELAAGGFDPAAERAKGAAFAAALLARRERERGGQAALEERRARLVQRAARRGHLTRGQLLARVELARLNPRLPEPAVLMLRKTKLDEATDEELEAMLDELEDLADTDDGSNGAGGKGGT